MPRAGAAYGALTFALFVVAFASAGGMGESRESPALGSPRPEYRFPCVSRILEPSVTRRKPNTQ